VGAPAIDRTRGELNGGTSTCRCSSALSGTAVVTTHENVVLKATGNDSTSGAIAFEWQGHDDYGNDFNFPGATYNGGVRPVVTSLSTKKQVYHWDWEDDGYSWTGFYRVVCMTNPQSLTYPANSPWSYDQ
jgi:hypothetical protein